MSKLSSLSSLGKVSLVLAVVLIACLLPLPYGFYTVIRLAVAVVAACWAYVFYSRRKTALAIVSASVALLFQPFLKIALDRLTWNIIDVILAGLIVFTVFSLNKDLK